MTMLLTLLVGENLCVVFEFLCRFDAFRERQMESEGPTRFIRPKLATLLMISALVDVSPI